jgi:hypothetical protein
MSTNIKKSGFCRFLLLGFLVFSLWALGTCMMPELTPELYVGTLDIDAGEVNIKNSGDIIMYGEEYLKIKNTPYDPIHYTDEEPDPNLLPWTGLTIAFVSKENVETLVSLSECIFTSDKPLDVYDRADHKTLITVARDGLEAYFSIAVLKRGVPSNTLLLVQEPAKTAYVIGEASDWSGLKLVGSSYDGANPPSLHPYAWPATIYPGDINAGAFDPAAPGSYNIIVTKPEGAVNFNIAVQAPVSGPAAAPASGPIRLTRADGSADWFDTFEATKTDINTNGPSLSPYKIELYENIELADQVRFLKGTDVLITGEGEERVITHAKNYYFFVVDEATLT